MGRASHEISKIYSPMGFKQGIQMFFHACAPVCPTHLCYRYVRYLTSATEKYGAK